MYEMNININRFSVNLSVKYVIQTIWTRNALFIKIYILTNREFPRIEDCLSEAVEKCRNGYSIK